MRRIAALLVACLAVITVWLQERAEPYRGAPVVLVESRTAPRFIGSPAIEGLALYRLSSPQYRFGSFSAMVLRDGGHAGLRLFSDYGFALDLPRLSAAGGRFLSPLRPVFAQSSAKAGRDIEAATAFEGHTWLALENSNAIMRIDKGLQPAGQVQPSAMAGWPANAGPEAFARLPDGRFLALREGRPLFGDTDPIRGVLFAGDPVAGAAFRRVEIVGAEGYHPVEATATPDGRLLVLLRKVTIALPIGFDTRLALLDPAEFEQGRARLRAVVDLSPPLPRDNYEGMALREDGGRWDVWLVADDNNSHFQASWLVRLAIDPDRLVP